MTIKKKKCWIDLTLLQQKVSYIYGPKVGVVALPRYSFRFVALAPLILEIMSKHARYNNNSWRSKHLTGFLVFSEA